MSKLKIIDLFAGIGGIRLGFEKSSKQGVECVFTSEWDKYSTETYKANFGNEPVFGDITKISLKDIPKHDILLAGFPCQPFSQAGLKKGFSDTRGTLFFDIERILKNKKPKAFLLENVKQLRGHDKGRTLNIIIERLREIGYSNVQYKVLRARDFGLPQNRERIYIVGFLDKNIMFNFPTPTFEPTKVGDILEKEIHDKYTISDRLWAGHQRRKRENKIKGKGFGYGIVSENSEYTNTISARYYKDGSEILIQQDGCNPRKLTPREAARLQGFPENFKIPVSNTQAYRQFGNSVPVKVVEKVAEQMLLHLEKKAIKIKPNKKIQRTAKSVTPFTIAKDRATSVCR
ncbi:DNA-cytosine methyltransferase [Bathymodiolus heckerae thiotrophic gill symbiont]|uniref:DNA cytosine methyltransferase n=1 Tax=Bathymodiolus heckerae thiotrophic gill symbiont TaxID=1052212 RepID=UPI0010B0C83C|nr:DNA cytosine methyltransferase [Bathymodiolus heckerae thiotrophic gill symbiont]SHN91985.1 DNA-cytosine methyltransferase [Bathymodiolus heckerae thiotrophic gill symbiont]